MLHSLRHLRPILIIAVSALNLIVIGLLAYALNLAKEQREREVTGTVENVATLLDHDIVQSASRIDLLLRDAVDELERQLRLRGGLDGPELNAFLSKRQDWLFGLAEFRVTDASGAVRYGPGSESETAATSFADGQDFFAHRSRKDTGLIVTNPFFGRAADTWLISFSRRYVYPDGSFGGMVAAAVPLTYFAHLLLAFEPGPHGVALLRDADGAVIARYPATDHPSQQIGSKAISKEEANIIASGAQIRILRIGQMSDSIDRIISYHRLTTVPFHLIVGMGPEDYLVPWHEDVAKAIGIAVFFILATSASAWLLWRSVGALQASEERYRALFSHMQSGFTLREVIWDDAGRAADFRFLAANDSYLTTRGFGWEDVIGKTLTEVYPDTANDHNRWMEIYAEVARTGAPANFEAFETAAQRWTEVTAYRAAPGQIAVLMNDITERKAGEARIRRLTNLYAALSQCNQAIVLSRTEDELFLRVCRCIVEYGFVKSTWIGLVDETSQQVRPVASYGDETGCLRHIRCTIEPTDPYGCGPTGTAIRENRPHWSDDYLNDPATAPWREQAHRAGWRSSAALPIRRNGLPVGALTIFSDTTNAFDDDARALLIEMETDISFALDNFAREAERHRSAEALRASEERYRTVFQTTLDAVTIIRLSDGAFVDANKAFTDISGYQRDDVIGRTALDLALWADPRDRENLLEALRQEPQWRDIEAQFRKKNGELMWGLMSVSVIEIHGIPCLLSITRDISDIKVAQDEIKTLAFYDPLTGLPNRRLLMDRLRQAIAASARSGEIRALLFVDLDNFKTLNDTLGHEIGDLLLQQVAQRLTACVREADTVARLGGDEFVIMLDELGGGPEESAAHAATVGEKLLAVVAQPYKFGDRECRITTSIGVALFGEQREEIGEVLKQSDIAMYQAKAAGRNAVRFFAPALQAAINERASMEEDLRQGIADHQFMLFYQPQVDRGSLIGAEALLRWKHPRRGWVSPGEFIPLAEETGLILPLGNWVLETACRQLAAWAGRQETRHISLAINVSARQFRQPDFVQQIVAVLDRTGADPQNVKLELTESMLLDNIEDVIAKMSALKARGLSFSLDDFGTGYSSLSYLRRLPLDQLKIDQSFVRDTPADLNNAAIAQTIITLGETMGLSVIAEGVETVQQQDFLAGLGCHSFQGYLFSRPVPVEQFHLLLAKSDEATSSPGAHKVT
jgi:diguanylate cyclase (GGDEF)-like protein/PAS domain S-box-containing protein